MIAAAFLAALTLHVTTPVTRSTAPGCAFVITAKVVEGGLQHTCLKTVDGYPAANATIRSSGTMIFALRRGNIAARISVVQTFGPDGRTAKQTLAGRITGGTGIYKNRHGTITGGGTLVDTATGLARLKLAYTLRFARG